MLRLPKRSLSVTFRVKNEYISMSRVPAKPRRKESPQSPIPPFKYEIERQIFKDAARHKDVLVSCYFELWKSRIYPIINCQLYQNHRYRQSSTKYFNSDELARKQWDHDTNFTHYDRYGNFYQLQSKLGNAKTLRTFL